MPSLSYRGLWAWALGRLDAWGGAPRGGLCIEAADNGVGILPENMSRLFTWGFTTKKHGHGFGLHISALAAEEMGGSLTCTSAGPGQGAAFIIELPAQGGEPRG